MPVAHVHAIAVRRHGQVERLHAVARQPDEDLRGLGLDLLLFLRDVRDHVVEDVHAVDARSATGARERLHRGHDHRLQAEVARERRERHDEAGRGAVRDRYHEALPGALALLALHEHRVLEVHARNHDRYVVLVAERRRGRHHGHVRRIALFERSRGAALDRGEHQVHARHVEVGRVHDAAIRERRGQALLTAPAQLSARLGDRLAIALARALCARRERRHLEPGVVLEGDQELLAGDAGGADDRDTTARGIGHEGPARGDR